MAEENKDIERKAERTEGVEETVNEGSVREVMGERIEALKGELQDAHVELSASKQTIEHLERRQKIGQILAASDAVDLEVASLLTEVAVAGMDEPDVEAAIEELRRQKPYLFGRQRVGGSAMAAKGRAVAGDDVGEAARRAVESGDRRDLLAYMRKRRGTGK